ncbi:hypothetical protein HY29_08995 [Hyphomonas beringensis]|uniref:Mechanosensitive ion channel protein MscS n=1 Tax=Hyphomonas beringensis TaxID=1280946 RepID=A0A062UIK4_9PROT|nr:mechanosensitive ion channel domain-containing protein [Hyphomonas beringensis]KCZ56419.1 hypothetical protein HY29_08995 [Hyphomonas beringensis]
MEEDGVIYQKCITGGDGDLYCRPIEATEATDVAPATTEDILPPVEDIVNPILKWLEPVRPFLDDPVGWLQTKAQQPEILYPIAIQIACIIAALSLGALLTPLVKRAVTVTLRRFVEPPRREGLDVLQKAVRPAMWSIMLALSVSLLGMIDHPVILVRTALSLSIAWLVIRVSLTFLPEELRGFASVLTWTFAIFFALGVLPDVVSWLSGIGPPFGERRISPVFIFQAIMTAAVLLFVANRAAKSMKKRVNHLPKVEPSIRILIGNAIQIVFLVAAVLLTLAGLGIPLGALTVISGAIGLGFAFGMQKVVSNFVSGIVLLSERSIKPQDVIEVGETFGVVESLGLRYTSITTQEGKEFLIPNEKLMTDTVINWSFSNKRVRIHKELRIDYTSDLEEAIHIVIEAAKSTDRVISWPSPNCLVKDFTDECIVLEMRFWIVDPQNGTANVASNILREVWKRFTENGMSVPLRRKELYIEPDSSLKVEIARQKRAGSEPQPAVAAEPVAENTDTPPEEDDKA